MTDVEFHSTAPMAQRARWRGRTVALAGAVVTVLCCVVAPSARSASADPIANARAQAAQITSQLQSDQVRLDEISQQYDAAQQQVQQLGQQVAQIQSTIASDRVQVTADQASLRQDALNSYMSGSSDAGLEALFNSSGELSAVATEYRSVATGDIAGAIDTLDVAQTHLAAQQTQLQAAQQHAQAALAQVASARQAAEATVANQESTLAGVKGQIASLVKQQQAAQQVASHQAFVAKLGGATLPNLPPAGGAARAVAAAESQIGVPYSWGGESPGVGFDCSGLTQWAWGQAGVGLPRTAQAQYDAVAHIPLSALQPGDLVFWGYGGGISHVAIYVGGGSVVHAPSTGQVVSIAGIWGNGLVGAGRP
ncbi:MAG TPA: C40 family peptidase [Acidimicrobiales bacterium]|nr:C40 family peptidase [Acidimicrobiales bacterium]